MSNSSESKIEIFQLRAAAWAHVMPRTYSTDFQGEKKIMPTSQQFEQLVRFTRLHSDFQTSRLQTKPRFAVLLFWYLTATLFINAAWETSAIRSVSNISDIPQLQTWYIHHHMRDTYACTASSCEEPSDSSKASSSEHRRQPRTSSDVPSSWNLALVLLFFLTAVSLDVVMNSADIQNVIRQKLNLSFLKMNTPFPLASFLEPSSSSPSSSSSSTHKLIAVPTATTNFNQPPVMTALSVNYTGAAYFTPTKNNDWIQPSDPRIIRNMKFLMSAVGLEILGTLALKFILPSSSLASVFAGLVSTRRFHVLTKLRQLLMVVPKVARFENQRRMALILPKMVRLEKLKGMLVILPRMVLRFEKTIKKISIFLKSIQKGLYSQLKPEEEEEEGH